QCLHNLQGIRAGEFAPPRGPFRALQSIHKPWLLPPEALANRRIQLHTGSRRRKPKPPKQRRAESLVGHAYRGGTGIRAAIQVAERIDKFERRKARRGGRRVERTAPPAERQQNKNRYLGQLKDRPRHRCLREIGPQRSAVAMKIFVPQNCRLTGTCPGPIRLDAVEEKWQVPLATNSGVSDWRWRGPPKDTSSTKFPGHHDNLSCVAVKRNVRALPDIPPAHRQHRDFRRIASERAGSECGKTAGGGAWSGVKNWCGPADSDVEERKIAGVNHPA